MSFIVVCIICTHIFLCTIDTIHCLLIPCTFLMSSYSPLHELVMIVYTRTHGDQVLVHWGGSDRTHSMTMQFKLHNCPAPEGQGACYLFPIHLGLLCITYVCTCWLYIMQFSLPWGGSCWVIAQPLEFIKINNLYPGYLAWSSVILRYRYGACICCVWQWMCLVIVNLNINNIMYIGFGWFIILLHETGAYVIWDVYTQHAWNQSQHVAAACSVSAPFTSSASHHHRHQAPPPQEWHTGGIPFKTHSRYRIFPLKYTNKQTITNKQHPAVQGKGLVGGRIVVTTGVTEAGRGRGGSEGRRGGWGKERHTGNEKWRGVEEGLKFGFGLEEIVRLNWSSESTELEGIHQGSRGGGEVCTLACSGAVPW